MRRLVPHLAALLVGLACLSALPAAAAMVDLLGTGEVRVESDAALPQWRRVVRGMAAEEPLVQACLADHERCPNQTVQAWLALLHGLDGAPLARQLDAVNHFVNRAPYRTDLDNYGRRDRWATPLEFFRRSGDCEDYAIAKYASLRRLGIAAAALRLVVVQDLHRGLPHAVLAVYEGTAVYILDNLSDVVREQAQVDAYRPYYSVSELAWWVHVPSDRAVAAGSAAPSPTRAAGTSGE